MLHVACCRLHVCCMDCVTQNGRHALTISMWRGFVFGLCNIFIVRPDAPAAHESATHHTQSNTRIGTQSAEPREAGCLCVCFLFVCFCSVWCSVFDFFALVLVSKREYECNHADTQRQPSVAACRSAQRYSTVLKGTQWYRGLVAVLAGWFCCDHRLNARNAPHFGSAPTVGIRVTDHGK